MQSHVVQSTCIYACVPKSEDAGLGSVDFLQKVAALSATSENMLVKGLVAQLCAPCLWPDADASGAKSDAKPSDVPASQCRYGCVPKREDACEGHECLSESVCFASEAETRGRNVLQKVSASQVRRLAALQTT